MASYRRDWERLILRLAPHYNVDPYAARAVALSEGLSGRVGDAGTSFGPFQLHIGGALPAGKGRAWAESKAGIKYALSRIGQVAGGLRGKAAVDAIVSQFERPADPRGEIQRAMSYYRAGGKVASNKAFGQERLKVATGGVPKRQALLNFIMANNQSFATTGKVDPNATMDLMTSMRQMEDYGLDGGHASNDSGIKVGSKQWSNDRTAMLQAMRKARRMGLHVGENPVYDTVDPVHTEGSYHYQTYGHSNVGRAADISGSASDMAAFYRWARRRYGQHLTELFYDPIGGIKFGNQIGAIGGHSDHVHIAF